MRKDTWTDFFLLGLVWLESSKFPSFMDLNLLSSWTLAWYSIWINKFGGSIEPGESEVWESAAIEAFLSCLLSSLSTDDVPSMFDEFKPLFMSSTLWQLSDVTDFMPWESIQPSANLIPVSAGRPWGIAFTMLFKCNPIPDGFKPVTGKFPLQFGENTDVIGLDSLTILLSLEATCNATREVFKSFESEEVADGFDSSGTWVGSRELFKLPKALASSNWRQRLSKPRCFWLAYIDYNSYSIAQGRS